MGNGNKKIIDNIIAFIKKSASSAAAKDGLIKEYGFTEPQAKAIVDMKLGKLAGLEKIELNNEKNELDKTVNELTLRIQKRELQEQVLKERLEDLVKKYGDARRTELTNIETPKEEKEIEKNVKKLLTDAGIDDRISLASAVRTQRTQSTTYGEISKWS